jgi:hypothetical protein
MMQKRWLLALAAAILVLAASTVAVGAQEVKGSIKGSVKNLTAEGSDVSGLDVTLLIFSGQEQSGEQTTKVDDQGNFLFQGLETGSEFIYMVYLQHQNVDYGSEPLAFPADKTELTVEIPCFDATTEASAITSPARHYLLNPDPEGVAVTEIVILRNSTDKSYTGAREIEEGIRETLRFTIPEGAVDLVYGDGMTVSRVIPVEGGFADTLPIYPGDSQRIFSYRIPAVNGSVNFSTRVTLASEKVSVLVPDVGADISVSNLPDRSNPTVQGDKFVLLSGENIADGTELQFKVDRLPSTHSASVELIPLLGGVGVVLIAVVGLVVVVRRRRSKRSAQVSATEQPTWQTAQADESVSDSLQPEVVEEVAEEKEPAVPETELLDAEKRDLISAIAQLDNQFESQQIGAEEYNRLRAEKKRRLIEVVGRQKELADEEGW